MIEITAIIARIKNDILFKAELAAYAEFYGSLPDAVEEMAFWDYLEKIKPLPYHFSEDDKSEFDHDLFLRLVVGSLSSDYKLSFTDEFSELPELLIHAKSNGLSIAKKISEVSSSQLADLIYIYLKEQISLQLIKQDQNEGFLLLRKRMERLEKWEAGASVARMHIAKASAKNRVRKLLYD